jgi:fatty acid synthase subunit alpha
MIEVGPSKVLTNLADKTWKKTFALQDTCTSKTRTLLSHSNDLSALEYEYATQDDEPEVVETAAVELPKPVPMKEAQSHREPVVVHDIPLKAIDLVNVIVAHKLKKPFDQLSLETPIRDLCQGKSTLQNEIVGDLSAEFSSIPSDVEDHSITALAAILERNFNQGIGKHVSNLISRLVSSKMPGGFSQASARDYLESYWGMGSQLQKSVICAAVTIQPSDRLQSVEAAREFFDSVTKRYSAFTGAHFNPRDPNSPGGSAAQGLTIDAEQMKTIMADEDKYLRKQHTVLSKHLKLEATSSEQEFKELQETNAILNGQLDQWTKEFDEAFLTGIMPAFEASKVRHYDSWWNWVRMDLFEALQRNSDVFKDRTSVQDLLNRWSPSCTTIVKHFIANQTDRGLKIPKEISTLMTDASAAKKPLFIYRDKPKAPVTQISPAGDISYSEVDRMVSGGKTTYLDLLESGIHDPAAGQRVPYIHLRQRNGSEWRYDAESSKVLLNVIKECACTGLNFSGKTVLITGAGHSSIGFEIVRNLLKAGARVLVTSSRSPATSAPPYNEMYRKHGGAGSELFILPYNQASAQDCRELIEHIYSSPANGGDLDFVIPFAAISETGQEIDRINARSELAHRLMLTNTLRLLGYIKKQKEKRDIANKPTTVILPLSPNHGTFGGDGLYSESKLGLETLFNKFQSEKWSSYLSICGAVIGWTRGTGLMSGNDLVSEAVEKKGAITFTQSEMAMNIIALMSDPVSQLCEDEPVYADLNGGVHLVPDLQGLLSGVRKSITEESQLRKALTAERKIHQEHLGKGPDSDHSSGDSLQSRANIQFNFPSLPKHQDLIAEAPDIQGMVDLSQTVVIVGFSELGPWGSARTRWEMERDGTLSIEGYCEMAWVMGLIKHMDLEGKDHIGWVDSQTNEPILDCDVGRVHGETIMKHCGIRTIEPEGLGGYDPNKKELLHEVVAKEDLPSFETSKDVARAFQLKHGDKVVINQLGDDEFEVQVKEGASFLVPKAVEFDRNVAGQLPKGWNAKHYGIPEDIITQTDPMTLYVLCCVNEALLSAGFHDPFEIWQHIHVSELANCVGTGAGSLLALRKVYKERYLDVSVQGDALQESFGNAMDAWTNMLLLASAGPIKSPSGTCTTAVESLDIACEGIRSGQVKMAIVGGSDDLQEEMSYEFGQMKATASSVEAISQGRLPSEMSRPTASSRSGFLESAGCGVQILMSADLALSIGVPIHAIVGYTQMAGDKIGRSIPAPGQGILTAAREKLRTTTPRILDLDFRRHQLKAEASGIEEWRIRQLLMSNGNEDIARDIESHATTKLKEAQRFWSNNLRTQDPGLSPIRAALATWGLKIDDIGFASFHGTSTKANEKNESDVINKMMTHLGRSSGNPLPVVCQKYLTGHPKGAAAAWMLNGCLQIFQSGCIPGNRNVDNVDDALQKFEHLFYPSKTMREKVSKAFMLTSFGFGQKGGLVVGIHPRYLFATITEEVYREYCFKAEKRQFIANSMLNEGLMDANLFKAKLSSPWKESDESAVFMNPFARARPDDTGVFTLVSNDAGSQRSDMRENEPSQKNMETTSQIWIEKAINGQCNPSGVGVDVESFDSIDPSNDVFIRRNFTEAERSYCRATPDSRASFAGRWAAKEAIFKSLGVKSRGAGAAMIDIEILSGEGKPVVQVCYISP